MLAKLDGCKVMCSGVTAHGQTQWRSTYPITGISIEDGAYTREGKLNVCNAACPPFCRSGVR